MSIRHTLAALPLAALTLSVAACSGGGTATTTSAESTSSTSDSGGDSAYVRATDSEPLGQLIPQDSNDTAALKVLDSVFSGLFSFDKDGKSHPEAAESVEAKDNNTHFVVHLKPGQVFADGSPVTAKSFTNAWSYANEHAFTNIRYYKNFKGYKESAPLNDALKVVDDNTFEIFLKKPQVDFPVQLGHPAFYPLPEAAYKDFETFGQKPFGNGPYKVKEWTHEKRIVIEKNDKYKGPRQAQNAGVDFEFFPTADAAYTALRNGDIDIVDKIPDTAFTTYQKDLDGRFSNNAAVSLESLHIPESLPHFSGEEGKLRRAAISQAINRKLIVDKIFHGTRTPATDFSSPLVTGSNQHLKGSEVLTYNPDKAKQLWDQANAISDWGNSTFYYSYNSDAGHQAWVDAVINSIKSTLDINAEADPYPDFKSLRSAVTEHTNKGAYRGSWSSSFPSVVSYIVSRYEAGDATQTQWKNEAYEKEVEAAASAPNDAEAQKHYDAAQEILLADLPSIPLWNSNAVAGWGPRLEDVSIDWHSVPIYYAIKVKN